MSTTAMSDQPVCQEESISDVNNTVPEPVNNKRASDGEPEFEPAAKRLRLKLLAKREEEVTRALQNLNKSIETSASLDDMCSIIIFDYQFPHSLFSLESGYARERLRAFAEREGYTMKSAWNRDIPALDCGIVFHF